MFSVHLLWRHMCIRRHGRVNVDIYILPELGHRKLQILSISAVMLVFSLADGSYRFEGLSFSLHVLLSHSKTGR